jgi:hypothetical protein
MNREEQFTNGSLELSKQHRLEKLGHLALTALIIAGLAGGTAGINHYLNQELSTDQLNELGPVDPRIESIILEVGARVRKGPQVLSDSDNNIEEVINKQVKITDPIRVHEDENKANGNWYGVQKSALKKAQGIEPEAGDENVYYWINKTLVTVKFSEDKSTEEERVRTAVEAVSNGAATIPKR